MSYWDVSSISINFVAGTYSTSAQLLETSPKCHAALWGWGNSALENERDVPQEFNNRGFPGGVMVKNLPANAGDMGSSPGLGRSHMPRSN